MGPFELAAHSQAYEAKRDRTRLKIELCKELRKEFARDLNDYLHDPHVQRKLRLMIQNAVVAAYFGAER